jgi:hypothetical protein
MRKVLSGLVCAVVMTTAACGTSATGSSAAPAPSCLRTVNIGDVTLPEGNPVGHTLLQPFVFPVRSSGCAAAGTMTYQTVDDNAVAGSDYGPVSGTMAFTAGDTTPRSVTVQVIMDRTPEPDERFLVVICPASNDIRTGLPGIGTIRNDDGGAAAAPVSFPALRANYGCGQ